MERKFSFLLAVLFFVFIFGQVFGETINYHETIDSNYGSSRNFVGGITENIPNASKLNYEKWKAEFLSTEFGKQMWEKFATNKNLSVNIVMSDAIKQGGQTSDFVWDEQANLKSVTIYIGNKIDKGLPSSIYYPVMSSIDEFKSRKEISGATLAATKLAHEFGHVNQTFEANQAAFQIQNKLMPLYNSIFLKNGYNVADDRLVDLSNQMGGTPIKIWEDREYWGEVSAMTFLLEASKGKPFYCNLVEKISENVAAYAIGYEDRFTKVKANNTAIPCKK
jgi:hypothetical protein